MCLKCCLQEPRTVLLALMLQRVLSAKGWGLLLSRRLASAVSVYPTPNEYAYKFVLPRRIAVNGCSVDLRSRDSFQPHRLDDVVAQVASTLFAIPAVDGLYFGPDFITVTRVRTAQFSAAVAWEEGLKQQIVAHLEVFCEEQEQQLHIKEAERLDSSAHFDDPTEALIVDILETQVRAVVQEDGGNIIFKRWDPVCGTVWVLMEGACVGCTMSKDTLHNGVLRLLQHYVPEVQAVCELTSVPVPAPPETLVTQ